MILSPLQSNQSNCDSFTLKLLWYVYFRICEILILEGKLGYKGKITFHVGLPLLFIIATIILDE